LYEINVRPNSSSLAQSKGQGHRVNIPIAHIDGQQYVDLVTLTFDLAVRVLNAM